MTVIMTNDVTIMTYIHNKMAVQCTQRWFYIRVYSCVNKTWYHQTKVLKGDQVVIIILRGDAKGAYAPSPFTNEPNSCMDE